MYKVECPYCETDNDVELEGSDGFDHICTGCDKEFEVAIEFEPIFSGIEIVHKNCVDCGKEYRFEGTSHPIPDKYRELYAKKNYFVCKSCFHRELIADLEKSGK
jgi:DNA-directed RNA polymerase subunit RPC12/RpoP